MYEKKEEKKEEEKEVCMQQLSRGVNIDDDYEQLSMYNRQLDDEWEAARGYIHAHTYIYVKVFEGIVSFCLFLGI